jgi:hypothetical protein
MNDLDSDCINGPWMNLMEDYISRDITNPSDRLPAISGVANILKQIFSRDYLAGHWKDEYLIPSLAWEVVHSGDYPRKSLTYRGPSWSWPSYTGVIDSFQFLHSVIYQDAVVLPENRVVEHNCALTTNDPCGGVASGHLTIRGYFLEARFKKFKPDNSRKDSWISCSRLHRNGVTLSCRPSSMDYPSSAEQALKQNGEVICWYIGYSEQDESNPKMHELLLLRKVSSQPELYERIGRTSLQEYVEIPPGWTDSDYEYENEVNFLDKFENCVRELTII